MKVSRREFIKSATTLSALLFTGAFSRLSQAYGSSMAWELGAAPLLYNRGKFRSKILLSCPTGFDRPQKSLLTILAFSPSGKLLWESPHQLSALQPLSLSLPQDLGWCSMVALLQTESPTNAGPSPSVEMAAFLSFDGPHGLSLIHI